MKPNSSSHFALSLIAAITLCYGPFVDPVYALELAPAKIAQAQSAPQEAPSFFRQAGKKLMENAQKRALEKINERMQNQSTQQAPEDSSTFLQPGSTTSVNVPATGQRQAAPIRSWVDPNAKPIACLLCVHGLGLQSNSYEFFGNVQSRRGLAVYAIDVRGFGSWINAKGKTEVNFNECLEDIKQALVAIRAANPGLPVYILGESMGGAIALRAASMYPELIDGLISSVPAGERFHQEKTSAKVFVNLLAGTDISNIGSDIINQATKNIKLKNQWQNDPLARLNLSPQELIQFQVFMNENHDAATKVTDLPVLFVQGNGDQLVKPEGTWELFNAIAAKDKSFFAVPGEHLIFEEAQTQEEGPRDQNFRVISSWLTAKVGRRRGGNRGHWRRSGERGFRGRRGNMSFVNDPALASQMELIDRGNYGQAIHELERLQSLRPNDANVLTLLGKAYYQSGQTTKAADLFRQAMRLRRGGGAQANALNSFLLSLGRSDGSPGGADTVPQDSRSSSTSPFAYGAHSSGWRRNEGSSALNRYLRTAPKAKVYAFYANWAEQCKSIPESIARLSSEFGDRVEINPVNIEDASSTSLVDMYKIGPIPTLVFVDSNGNVGSTIIGESSYGNYEAALRSILWPSGRRR